MFKIQFLTTLIIFSINLNIAFAEKITDKNWINHPEIIKIRNIYKDIKSYEIEYRTIDQSCAPEPNNRFPKLSTILIDNEKLIKTYSLSTTNEETAERTEYYYDDKRTLRFILFSCSFQDKGHLTSRIYFDKTGKEIYINKETEGEVQYCNIEVRAILKPKEHYNEYCF